MSSSSLSTNGVRINWFSTTDWADAYGIENGLTLDISSGKETPKILTLDKYDRYTATTQDTFYVDDSVLTSVTGQSDYIFLQAY